MEACGAEMPSSGLVLDAVEYVLRIFCGLFRVKISVQLIKRIGSLNMYVCILIRFER